MNSRTTCIPPVLSFQSSVFRKSSRQAAGHYQSPTGQSRLALLSWRRFIVCRRSLPHREASNGGTLDPHPQAAACAVPRMQISGGSGDDRMKFGFLTFLPAVRHEEAANAALSCRTGKNAISQSLTCSARRTLETVCEYTGASSLIIFDYTACTIKKANVGRNKMAVPAGTGRH